jgi:hypothetical protein
MPTAAAAIIIWLNNTAVGSLAVLLGGQEGILLAQMASAPLLRVAKK